ncbi:MAG: hypothetical protein E6Q88_01010 [Lysobacteraceae bacterium]|nr:MAG: hypothetical protein E6Q88_01010 [Xanthomonadaceae bacterium]
MNARSFAHSDVVNANATHTSRIRAWGLLIALGSVLTAACGQQGAVAAGPEIGANTPSNRTAKAAPETRKALAPIQPGIPLDLSYVDRKSPAFARFKTWVDSAVAGQPGYAFSAYDAALLYRLNGQQKYCDLAVKMIEKEVADAEAAIAEGRAPEIAGDSYLEVGPRIAALSMTLDSCKAQIDQARRERWSAFAEQAVWNVWHHLRAHWGGRPRPWTGWSVDNPGNNYYYSFVEATLYWALVSGSDEWMRFLNEEKIPPLIAYFADLRGGGSLEGTGYGAAHMRLFALYRLWRDATGEDIANASPHVGDTIAYWVHATVPALDRFAPIGDQSRNSMPELYDYHRRLVLEARALSKDPQAQALASWWLHRISVPKMSNGFNTLHDLLPAGEKDAPPPVALFHHAVGTGHLFARSGWDRDAMWLAFVAGPYNESHAHQEQGGFTLFAGDWLSVTGNVWSHSGIQQGTETHNVLRFERAEPIERQCHAPQNERIVHQCVPTVSSMRVTPGANGALTVEADLGGAYGEDSAVRSWRRTLEFGGRRLRISDRYRIAGDTRAIFQLLLPVAPRIDGHQARAGNLRVKVVSPADARMDVVELRSLDPAEFRNGWRLDISGPDSATIAQKKTEKSGDYVIELDEIKN